MSFASWGKARQTLALAALLDAAGLLAIFVAVAAWRGVLPDLQQQKSLMATLVLSYCTFGWLFGSYTLLKLRRVKWSQVILRLGATSTAAILLGALLEWSWRASPSITLLHRSTLIASFAGVTLWSGANRWLLRRVPKHAGNPRWLLLSLPGELENVSAEWARGSSNRRKPSHLQLNLQTLSDDVAVARENAEIASYFHHSIEDADGVALTAGVSTNPNLHALCEQIVGRGIPVITLVELAERELQRIPPKWIGSQWLLFSHRIEGQQTNPNQQLKRYADLTLSLILIAASSPLWALSAFCIYLQDRGPVFYKQQRTGLLGSTFEVLKFRSMITDAEQQGIQWASHNDQRITPIGKWLRRTRIDELPQLLNVLRGEMSLIGPRPERPELEADLEQHIPNYRLRHWIRPGLSGWAQVNMPYSSSIEDSATKLSYDLYYLRNTSPWLDLLILLKTIKTVLKGAGR